MTYIIVHVSIVTCVAVVSLVDKIAFQGGGCMCFQFNDIHNIMLDT